MVVNHNKMKQFFRHSAKYSKKQFLPQGSRSCTPGPLALHFDPCARMYMTAHISFSQCGQCVFSWFWTRSIIVVFFLQWRHDFKVDIVLWKNRFHSILIYQGTVGPLYRYNSCHRSFRGEVWYMSEMTHAVFSTLLGEQALTATVANTVGVNSRSQLGQTVKNALASFSILIAKF